MRVLIQSNVQMGFGTILSNLYECIHISQKLKNHHRILYVNCSRTLYFNAELFQKIFNMDYLLSEFEEVLISDTPYEGDLIHSFTLGGSKKGIGKWDIFLSDVNNDIKYFYDNRLGVRNVFSFNSDRIKINGEFNIFSKFIYDHYVKKNEDYVAISFRGKNMTDVQYPINNNMEKFLEIISKNKTYICGTSMILKEKLSVYDNVFFNKMYINEEDFKDVYDEEKLKELILLCLDILYLRDSKHIYHFTYFNSISYFLFIPYLNNTPIVKIPIGYKG